MKLWFRFRIRSLQEVTTLEPASRPDLAPVIISISAVPGPIPKVAGRVCRKYLTIAISFLFPFTKER
jgi:hypothetical protein